jgi:selenide,water dikinase
MSESNQALAAEALRFDREVDDARRWLLFDPQTSGGLLISIAPARAEAILEDLQQAGQSSSRLVGEVFESSRPLLEIAPS